MSRYSNRIMKNNVHATLSTALSSVATTIQLTTGQWARFGTEFPQIATLESFDDTWKVIKREIVQITARNGDDLTVVRAFAPCPANDDANSQSQSAISFSADDQISLYIPKEILQKINECLLFLQNYWNDRMRVLPAISGDPLKIDIMPWVFRCASDQLEFAWLTDYSVTDDADNYISIDWNWDIIATTTWRDTRYTRLAKVTCSWWEITNIVDWRMDTLWWNLGELLIHELTEKTDLKLADEFILSDSETAFTNKRVSFWTVKTNILKDKSTLSSLDYPCGENIDEWDCIYLEEWVQKDQATNIQLFGDSTTPKVALKQYWLWVAGQNITIQLWIVYWETPTDDLILRIESDDNWKPSWTLISWTTEQSIPLDLFKGWRGDIAVDVWSQNNFYNWFAAWEPLMSADWKQVIIYNQNWPQTARLYSLSTPYDFTTATYIGAKILPTTNNSNYYHHMKYVDNWNKLFFRRNWNSSCRVYDLSTPYDASSFGSVKSGWNFGTFWSLSMTEDWKHIVAFQYRSSSNYEYRVYELTTAFDPSAWTTLVETTTFTTATYYGQAVSMNNEWTVLIYSNDRSWNYWIHRIETSTPYNFTAWTHKLIVSSTNGSFLTACNEWKNIIVSNPYDIYSYSIESNQKKWIDFQLDDEITIPLWTPFHFVIVPTEATNAQFELYYWTKNWTLKPYETNDWSSWTTVANSEAYCLTDFSLSYYYMKQTASDLEKIWTIKISQWSCDQWEIPYFDFDWISRHFSWLISWSAYYLSDTPWKVSTTPWTNVKFIWIAKSDKEIELATKNIVPILVLSNTAQTTSTTETILKQFDMKRAWTYKMTITYWSTNTTNNTNASKIKILKSNTEIRSDNIIAYGGCCAVIVFTANVGDTIAITWTGASASIGIKITQVVVEKIDVIDWYVENVID